MLFCLMACRKEEKLSPVTAAKAKLASSGIKYDTIPDKAVLKIELFRDSIISDETAIAFEHTACLAYNSLIDAPYFAGTGQLSFASISSDGRDLAINTLPYKQGMAIRFDVHAKTDGLYKVMVSSESAVPSDIHIWLKDKYLKDSVDISKKNYSFKISQVDTNSFGKNRLELILKE